MTDQSPLAWLSRGWPIGQQRSSPQSINRLDTQPLLWHIITWVIVKDASCQVICAVATWALSLVAEAPAFLHPTLQCSQSPNYWLHISGPNTTAHYLNTPSAPCVYEINAKLLLIWLYQAFHFLHGLSGFNFVFFVFCPCLLHIPSLCVAWPLPVFDSAFCLVICIYLLVFFIKLFSAFTSVCQLHNWQKDSSLSASPVFWTARQHVTAGWSSCSCSILIRCSCLPSGRSQVSIKGSLSLHTDKCTHLTCLRAMPLSSPLESPGEHATDWHTRLLLDRTIRQHLRRNERAHSQPAPRHLQLVEHHPPSTSLCSWVLSLSTFSLFPQGKKNFFSHSDPGSVSEFCMSQLQVSYHTLQIQGQHHPSKWYEHGTHL